MASCLYSVGDTCNYGDMMYNILEDYENPMPGEGPFYTDYLWKAQADRDVGIEFIDWDEDKYTFLNDHKNSIIPKWNLYFKYRELGSETESRFQDMVQDRFNQVADKYNHAFKVTEENDVDVLGTSYNYTESRIQKRTGTGSSTGSEDRDQKYKDTPSTTTSVINNPTTQNMDNRTNESNIETEENLDDKITRDNTKHDEEMIVELNQLIDKYKQLEIDFIKEFEVCFMGLIGHPDEIVW